MDNDGKRLCSVKQGCTAVKRRLSTGFRTALSGAQQVSGIACLTTNWSRHLLNASSGEPWLCEPLIYEVIGHNPEVLNRMHFGNCDNTSRYKCSHLRETSQIHVLDQMLLRNSICLEQADT